MEEFRERMFRIARYEGRTRVVLYEKKVFGVAASHVQVHLSHLAARRRH
jgi:hypothetical protein